MANPQDEAEKAIRSRPKITGTAQQIKDFGLLQAVTQLTDELTRLRTEMAATRVALVKVAGKQ